MDAQKNERILIDGIVKILDEGNQDLKSKETVISLVPDILKVTGELGN
jgi:hypothetical protein